MLTAARVMPSDTRPTHSPEAIGSIVLIQTLSQDSEVVLARLIDSLTMSKDDPSAPLVGGVIFVRNSLICF
ncbi:hypothetical protein AVDCRST_MAG84-6214 [uncultured Microcoleus sp.]|uniref:Uncharacterized protein n=1 Tax=uncultured Microcoleus sp. TaxID=259945 RepID=A0A6J4P2U9_9CYAN|nr:hypothetical protein AVDCRST_MAG84-6214 [uncultured Microcoleus sp.]